MDNIQLFFELYVYIVGIVVVLSCAGAIAAWRDR